MTNRTSTPTPESPAGAQPRIRAAYRSPRILYREKLEVVAAICSPGKAFGQGGDCSIQVSS